MGINVSTISNPEFINLEPLDINPLMSQCEIKVLYVGGNRNGSFISKDTASEMAKTLRGAPIVGWYNENKEDFVDHGDQIIIDGDGIKFNSLTKPYGFVAPDAQVWFQTFEETDEFGNKVEREYLMTTGYLWTGQYEEANLAIQQGRPQSMELDNSSLDGHWTRDSQSGIEFFIINDAVFSKLCILGEDVEPCFEGASVTAPEVSNTFTLDENFKQTLYSMMQELQFALKGGQQQMDETEEKKVDETLDTSDETEYSKNEDTVEEENSNGEDLKDETEEPVAADEYALLKQDYEDLQKKYEEVTANYDKINEIYQAMKEKTDELVNFKNQVEDAQKDELINKFYMLSDEDKKEVIEHKSEYTLDEIEAKLSVICFRNKVNFNTEIEEEEKKPSTTFTLEDESDSVPAWVSALRNTKNSKNN